MSLESVSLACLIIADVLADDKKAKKIIDKIDNVNGDDDLKSGIRDAVAYLKSKKKFAIADDIVNKTKGFAF